MAAAWFLGLLLFSVTLGIGYIIWSLFGWRHGRSPAQRILSLRCWLPEAAVTRPVGLAGASAWSAYSHGSAGWAAIRRS